MSMVTDASNSKSLRSRYRHLQNIFFVIRVEGSITSTRKNKSSDIFFSYHESQTDRYICISFWATFILKVTISFLFKSQIWCCLSKLPFTLLLYVHVNLTSLVLIKGQRNCLCIKKRWMTSPLLVPKLGGIYEPLKLIHHLFILIFFTFTLPMFLWLSLV